MASTYLDALKATLRERQVRYSEVAESLGCSLPTVKRLLNKPSLPFDRLLQLCEIAGIPFSELHTRAEQLQPKHYVFNEPQDRLFDEQAEVLDYFLELAVEGLNPAQIAERHDLDAASTEIYLDRLLAVGLVERIGRRGARAVAAPPFGFGTNSRVLRKMQETFMNRVISETLTQDAPSSAVFLKPLRLTEGDYNQMLAAFGDVVDRFSAISERGVEGKATMSWQVALAAGPGPDTLKRHLPRLGP